jgi:hypothetical protein
MPLIAFWTFYQRSPNEREKASKGCLGFLQILESASFAHLILRNKRHPFLCLYELVIRHLLPCQLAHMTLFCH